MPFDLESAVNAPDTSIATTPFDINSAQETNPPVPEQKPGPIATALRSVFKYTAPEEIQTLMSLSKGADQGTLPKPYKGEGFGTWINRVSAPREKDIINQGVVRQLEGPMTAAIAASPAGGLEAAVVTAHAVRAYSLVDNFFNARRWIDQNAPNTNPLIKEGVEIADFVLKGGLIGGSFAAAKNFTMDRVNNLNLPKSVDIPSELINNLKNTEIAKDLGINNEHIDASVNSGLPVSVPLEKVIDLGKTDKLDKLKEALSLNTENPVIPTVKDGKVIVNGKPSSRTTTQEAVDFGAKYVGNKNVEDFLIKSKSENTKKLEETFNVPPDQQDVNFEKNQSDIASQGHFLGEAIQAVQGKLTPESIKNSIARAKGNEGVSLQDRPVGGVKDIMSGGKSVGEIAWDNSQNPTVGEDFDIKINEADRNKKLATKAIKKAFDSGLTVIKGTLGNDKPVEFWKKMGAKVNGDNIYLDKQDFMNAKGGDLSEGQKGKNGKEGLQIKLNESGAASFPIDEYIKKSTETVPVSKNMETAFTELKTQAAADNLRARQLLENLKISPKDAEAIYHHQENSAEPLTAEQQRIYDEIVKPLSDKSAELFAKLRNEGVPVNSEGYTPRFVSGKGNIFDRLESGAKNVGGATSGLLKKSSGSFKKRVMMAITDEHGARQVVAIKDGEVVSVGKETSTSLGKLNSKTNEDLLDKETAPIEAQMKKLENEEKILMANPYRMEATRYSIRDIQNKLMDLNMKRMELSWKYNPDNLEDKFFVDKNGKKWQLGQATTKEIEAKTNLTYHKNAILNNLVHYNELRKIDRATQYLENIKNNKDFQKFSMKLGTGNPPEGWKSTSLPQFRGYYFEPRIADSLNYFNDKLYKGEDPLRVFTALNRFLRTSIFFNPLIHIPNITTHWLVNRGTARWLVPNDYVKLWTTSARAIDAVLHQNKDYLEMLDKGVNLVYHETTGTTLTDLLNKKMGEELSSNQKLGQVIKDAFGVINPYKFSGKATWAANDIATMQAIYEDMANGKTMDEAIHEVSKHIPNYVVPSRVLNSKELSQVMTNPNVTMFGAYHYGALKSYGEMAKSIVGNVPAMEKVEALDKLAMLGILSLVIYPTLDQILKDITGNPNAHLRRAGPTTFPENMIKLQKGQIDVAQALQSVLTPAVGAKQGIELAFNRDLFTGDKVLHRGQVAKDLKDMAVESVAPLNSMQRVHEGKISLSDYLMSLGGVSVSDANVGKIYNMKDSKMAYQKEVDRVYATDPEKANAMAEEFNKKQLADLHQISKESNYHDDVPQKYVNSVCITSFKGVPEEPVQPHSKSVSEVIDKEKSLKRTPIDNPPEY